MSKEKFDIRVASIEDLPLLHQCFESSVLHTCSKDYNEQQISAWIIKADKARWQELLNSGLHFMIAEEKQKQNIAGFTSINREGYLHSMFVHPDCQHQGVATQLLEEAERFAGNHQVTSVFSEVSLTAKGFFFKMGYSVEKAQTVIVNQVAMINFAMRKPLTGMNDRSSYTITQPTPQEYPELIRTWETSVRSTHDFLTEEDILFYKQLVPEYFPQVDLYIIRNGEGKIVAFMGLSEVLVEMLFVLPKEQGKGLGKQLLQFAIREKGLRKVDVNEQNKAALQFYKHLGFEVTGRDETDSSGKPFPILHMQIDKAHSNQV